MSVIAHVADRLSGGKLTKRDFEARLLRYAKTRTHEIGDGRALVDAFLKSAGVWLTEASQAWSRRTPKYDFSNAVDVLGLWREPGSMERALENLRAKGYAILDVALPASVVEKLSADFAKAPCTLTSDKGSSLAEHERVTVDLEHPLAEKYAVDTNALVQNPTVRELLLDRGLLEIAQEYIGSAPVIDIITAWYSFPSDTPSHEAAQLFHFDMDRVRWLKAFFLLTDQTADTGAHLYIPGTQRDGGIAEELLERGYARLEDDEVAKFYPRDSWKTMEAVRGKILLEDTRGLHKGIRLKRNHRLMLQFEYAQNLFGEIPFLATVDLDPVDDPHWQAMRAAYPGLFAALDR